MSIRFEEKGRLFFLETKNSLYQIKAGELGILMHTYYGAKVGTVDMSYQIPEIDRGFSGNPYEKASERGFSQDTIPQEYTSSGVGDYRIESIACCGEDGSQSIDFRYVSHKIESGKYTIPGLPSVRDEDGEAETLTILLQDEAAHAELELRYGVFAEKDVITRCARIRNLGQGTLKLEKAASMSLDFVHQKLDMIHFHGRHCMERMFERTAVGHEVHVIGSKRGMSSHHHNPYVILCDPNTDENQGNCYGFMMVYSGNHKAEIEMDQMGNTRIVMGIHDQFFSWNLGEGEVFDTPEVILSRSEKGFNGLSQNYHRIIKENVCNPRYQNIRRPVLINNWEATYFDFDTDKILTLARQAKDIGIEMLVLDDGWFGKRNDDNSGLGDWHVNEAKLPGGLRKLSREITEMGLQFGLWLEPEMVSEDSDLFRKHPEWALQDPGRKPTLARNQLVLDMSNEEVQNYLYECISKILDEAHISYIKWDFNRSVANAYSRALPPERQGEVMHRFILGTYALLERILANYPKLMMEGCAGGGGRFDAGMLYYTPQIWCSDDTDAIARLQIQRGTSYGYPVCTVGSHVSASPNHQTGRSTSLHTRGVVAMAGSFGYELDLNHITEGEKREMAEQIETFKKYYWLIQDGTYYRLNDSRRDEFYEAWEMVARDRSEVLVSYVLTDTHANSEVPWIRLLGLEESEMYQLEGTDAVYSGAALMRAGIGLKKISGDYPADQMHFVRV